MKAPGGAATVLALAGLLVALAPALAQEDERVVVSRPGTVFHRSGATDLRGRGYEKPLAQALASGYAPCTICFSKSALASLHGSAAPGAASAAVSGGSVAVPPGLRGTSTVLQPNGVQIGRVHGPGFSREGIRDPFEPVSSIINPGKEEGAYGTDQDKGRY